MDNPAQALAESEAPLHRSTELVEAAASGRTEWDVRYDRVRELLLAHQRAQSAATTWYRENRDRKDEPENEDWVRSEIVRNRLIRAVVKTREAYHAACDSFFANAAERPIAFVPRSDAAATVAS